MNGEEELNRKGAKALTRIDTNFLTTDGHGWTRIKNNDFDANFANYHEFFQSYGIDRLTSAINREFFVNRIDHYRWTQIKSGVGAGAYEPSGPCDVRGAHGVPRPPERQGLAERCELGTTRGPVPPRRAGERRSPPRLVMAFIFKRAGSPRLSIDESLWASSTTVENLRLITPIDA
jgi:hypothetical protein